MAIEYFDATIAVLFDDHHWDERKITHLAVEYNDTYETGPDEMDVQREAEFHLVGNGEGETATVLLKWEYSQEKERDND